MGVLYGSQKNGDDGTMGGFIKYVIPHWQPYWLTVGTKGEDKKPNTWYHNYKHIGQQYESHNRRMTNNMLTIILTNYLTPRRMGTRALWVKKYLIPNNMLTIISTNYLTFRRMGTRAGWVKKYLIPNNRLTIILTNYLTLRRLRRRAQWVNKYLIPNTKMTIITTHSGNLTPSWKLLLWIKGCKWEEKTRN